MRFELTDFEWAAIRRSFRTSPRGGRAAIELFAKSRRTTRRRTRGGIWNWSADKSRSALHTATVLRSGR